MTGGASDEMGRRARRQLYITPPADAPTMVGKDVLFYRVYDGDQLLFERRGSPTEIAELREHCEPLRDGWRATLGTGRASDPEIALGPPPTGVDLDARKAADWHKYHMRVAKDELEYAQFQRQFLVDTLAQVASAREEEAARWRPLVAHHQHEARRPLLDAEQIKGAMQSVGPIVGELFEFIRQLKNAKGQTNGG